MHRPSAFLGNAKTFVNIGATAARNFVTQSADAVMAMLVQSGIMAAAERENRRRARHAKRQHRNSAYFETGLNGKRAVARRLRQIQRGSLRVENGLVS